MVQLSHAHMTTEKTMALTRWTFVCKVMSLLYKMLSMFVVAFLLRSKCLLISWLQAPSAVWFSPCRAFHFLVPLEAVSSLGLLLSCHPGISLHSLWEFFLCLFLCWMGILGPHVLCSGGFPGKGPSERNFLRTKLSEDAFSSFIFEWQFTWVLNSRLKVISPQKFEGRTWMSAGCWCKGKPETVVIPTPWWDMFIPSVPWVEHWWDFLGPSALQNFPVLFLCDLWFLYCSLFDYLLFMCRIFWVFC